MERHLQWLDSPSLLREAMQYSLFAGGKRLRPVLTLAAAEACGAEHECALDAAVALEFVHTYSLIHDDLPAMDDDDLRRGKPTNHKVFGDGMAILAGDALLTEAFAIISLTQRKPETTVAMVRELAKDAGPQGMVAGQVIDILGQVATETDLLAMHSRKTGALLRAAVRLGAIAANASDKQLQTLTTYAEALGLCFQIVDDILDVVGNVNELGKEPGADARAGKKTIVDFWGVDKARTMVAQYTERAVASIEDFGPRGEHLRQLALNLSERSS